MWMGELRGDCLPVRGGWLTRARCSGRPDSLAALGRRFAAERQIAMPTGQAVEKDNSIIAAVTALQTRFGETLHLSDHWDGDLMAIGVCGDQPNRLVYFSTFQRAAGHYYVDLESPAPAGSSLPYRQGERLDDVDFDTLVAIVAHHLNLVPR
jgi:hypothetical protein